MSADGQGKPQRQQGMQGLMAALYALGLGGVRRIKIQPTKEDREAPPSKVTRGSYLAGSKLVDQNGRHYFVDATGSVRRSDFPQGRTRRSKKQRLRLRRMAQNPSQEAAMQTRP